MAKRFMSLLEICEKYAPAYKDSWEDWWSDSFHSQSPLIKSLVEELIANGSFDEPVVLEEEDNESGTFFPATISNGMHRMAAHHMTGIDQVHVEALEDRKGKTTETDFLEVEVSEVKLDDDFEWIDDFTEWLSWRVFMPNGSTLWLRMESFSSSGPMVSLLFYGYKEEFGSLDEYKTAIQERLIDYGKIESIKVLDFSKDEDGY